MRSLSVERDDTSRDLREESTQQCCRFSVSRATRASDWSVYSVDMAQATLYDGPGPWLALRQVRQHKYTRAESISFCRGQDEEERLVSLENLATPQAARSWNALPHMHDLSAIQTRTG
jgi:hypothetical protein